MKLDLGKKFLVFGVVMLLLALTYTPTTQAKVDYKPLINEKELINVEIEEYKSDGNIVKNIIKLTQTEINSLRDELINAKTTDDQISIFKKYNLISKDVKVDDLESGMYQKAEKLGINKDLFPNKISIRAPILLQLFKKVNIVYIGGLSLRLGLTPIIRLIDRFLPVDLPDVDIVTLNGALFGVIRTEGILASHTLITFPSISGMLGFVGFTVKVPLLMRVYTGFSVATFGIGLGLHLRDSNINWNATG